MEVGISEATCRPQRDRWHDRLCAIAPAERARVAILGSVSIDWFDFLCVLELRRPARVRTVADHARLHAVPLGGRCIQR